MALNQPRISTAIPAVVPLIALIRTFRPLLSPFFYLGILFVTVVFNSIKETVANTDALCGIFFQPPSSLFGFFPLDIFPLACRVASITLRCLQSEKTVALSFLI